MSDQAPEADGDVLARLGMDGHLWAKEFQITAVRLGYQPMDEGWLIGWFCNAIMAGYDTAENRARLDTVYTRAQVEAMVAEERQLSIRVAASLNAAISLLERGGEKAAPSGKMFRQMLVDYHKALDDWRAAIRAQGEAV